ncbi:MAG: hypothetical protein NCA08_00805 [Deltaproteobacteria bacterium]|nr:hypothetical protein [Candidatus Deferrimicrobium borealis]
MRGTRLRSTGKSVVTILCTACFLTTSLGSVSHAVAAGPWETWPKKTAEPIIEQKPATDSDESAKTWKMLTNKTAEPIIEQKPATVADGAPEAGDAAGKKTATGSSYRTIGWIALGIAAVIGIAIAAGGGGDGGGTVMNPGHQ